MYKARKNVEIKGKKRDIIEDYANFGSTVYAPITRDGLSLDKKANKYEVQPEALSSYLGIEELSRSLPSKVFQSGVSIDSVKTKFNTNLSRGEVAHMAQLKKAQASINVQIQQQHVNEAGNEGKDLLSDIKMRPHTPVFNDMRNKRQSEADLEKNDEKRRAVTLLQRLLRGRAM